MSNLDLENRRLAAIVFTDLAGFTALSQQNERLALDILSEAQGIQRAAFAQHGGQEIKSTGDGFLAVFPSALQAMRCALDIQERISLHNQSGVSSHPFGLRIGVHLGDVVERDGDVYGDGVNTAARIEPLAESGGICVSGSVYSQVHNKVDSSFERLEAKDLKGISAAVEVYKVVPGAKGPAQVSDRRKTAFPPRTLIIACAALIAIVGGVYTVSSRSGKAPTPTASKQSSSPYSIAVLPFVNIGPNPDDEHIGDGLTEELINALANVPGLRVPARTSVFYFKNRNEDIKKIGNLLQVDRVIEGSIRRDRNNVRITAQLINVSDGYHVWSEQYDRKLSGLLAVQEEITDAIVQKLQLSEKQANSHGNHLRPSQNMDAWESYQRARSILWRSTYEADYRKAISHFKEAIQKDPSYAEAYAGLSDAYTLLSLSGYERTREIQSLARAAADKALSLEPNGSEALRVAAGVKFNFDWNWAAAEVEYRRAITLDPRKSSSRTDLAWLLYCTGRLSEALKVNTEACRLDPLNSYIHETQIYLLWDNGKTDEALEMLERLRELNPGSAEHHIILGSAYIRSGAPHKAIKEFESAIDADRSLRYLMWLGRGYGLSGRTEEATKVLAEMKNRMLQEGEIPVFLALVYDAVGDFESANSWMTRAIAARDPALMQMKSLARQTNPYFLSWLRKIGLPD